MWGSTALATRGGVDNVRLDRSTGRVPQLLRGLREPIRITGGDHHVHPLCGKSGGDGPADAPTPPGHDGALRRELKVHDSFPLVGQHSVRPGVQRLKTGSCSPASIAAVTVFCAGGSGHGADAVYGRYRFWV
jgi:hypothetical protein